MGTFLQSLFPNFRSSSLRPMTDDNSGIRLTDTETALILSVRRNGYERVCMQYLNLTEMILAKYTQLKG